MLRQIEDGSPFFKYFLLAELVYNVTCLARPQLAELQVLGRIIEPRAIELLSARLPMKTFKATGLPFA